jgi:ribonuclease P/MRP protein subunit RPP40
LLKWIESFLTNRTQCVRVGNVLSPPVEVTSGTPQGGVLSPLLFLLYINDLPECLGANVKCKMYADDAKIYQIFHRSDVNNQSLQHSLDSVSVWASTWQMKLAAEKCHVLRIGYKNPLRVLSVGDVALASVENVNDLGIKMSNTLKYSTHCAERSRKASQRANLIFRSFRTSHVDTLMLAFKVFVRSLLEYCTSVYSPGLVANANVIEQVQRNFTRRVCQKFFTPKFVSRAV